MSEKTKIPQMMEAAFDVLYLLCAVIVGIFLLWTGKGDVRTLYGLMALVLAFGDAFHLVPRIREALFGTSPQIRRQKGYGKMATSITMTAFYVILYHIGLLLFGGSHPLLTAAIYVLAVLRILLCLCKKNEWTAENPPFFWNVLRNIPFVLLGLLVLIFFAAGSGKAPVGVALMPVAIFLSFAFYLPVVLLSHKKPKIGMLMIPKTCAYVWILFMGLSL